MLQTLTSEQIESFLNIEETDYETCQLVSDEDVESLLENFEHKINCSSFYPDSSGPQTGNVLYMDEGSSCTYNPCTQC